MARQQQHPPTIARGIVLVALFVALVLPCTVLAQPAPPREQQAPRTPYDTLLDLEAAQARETAQRAGQIAGVLEGEPGLEVTGGVLNFGAAADPDEHLRHIEERRAALHHPDATAPDRAGLGYLIAGDYARAERMFRRSQEFAPGRGLPLLFLGVAQLEQGRWADAAESLAQAERFDSCMPTATLLRTWAQACVDDPPADAVQEGLCLYRAMASLQEVEFDFARIVAGRFHFNESRALYWAQGAAYNLGHGRMTILLEAGPDPQRPHSMLATYAALTPANQFDAHLELLQTEFPDDADLAEHAFWRDIRGIGTFGPEPITSRWPEVQAWAAVQRRRAPHNGMYDLMRVMPVRHTEVVRDEFGAYLDEIDHTEPYTEDEVAALQEALDAPFFEHPGSTTRDNAWQTRRELFGPFLTFRGMAPMGYPSGWIRSIAWRYRNTFSAYVQADGVDEGMAVGELLCGVSLRVAMLEREQPGVALMVHGSIEALVAMQWIRHGVEHGDLRVLRAGIAKYAACRRTALTSRGLAMPMSIGEVLPVERMRRGAQALTLSAFEAGHPAAVEVALDEANDHVEHYLERFADRDETDEEGYFLADAIILLTDLGEPRALPLIEPLQDDDNLLISELARWSVQQFASP